MSQKKKNLKEESKIHKIKFDKLENDNENLLKEINDLKKKIKNLKKENFGERRLLIRKYKTKMINLKIKTKKIFILLKNLENIEILKIDKKNKKVLHLCLNNVMNLSNVKQKMNNSLENIEKENKELKIENLGYLSELKFCEFNYKSSLIKIDDLKKEIVEKNKVLNDLRKKIFEFENNLVEQNEKFKKKIKILKMKKDSEGEKLKYEFDIIKDNFENKIHLLLQKIENKNEKIDEIEKINLEKITILKKEFQEKIESLTKNLKYLNKKELEDKINEISEKNKNKLIRLKNVYEEKMILLSNKKTQVSEFLRKKLKDVKEIITRLEIDTKKKNLLLKEKEDLIKLLKEDLTSINSNLKKKTIDKENEILNIKTDNKNALNILKIKNKNLMENFLDDISNEYERKFINLDQKISKINTNYKIQIQKKIEEIKEIKNLINIRPSKNEDLIYIKNLNLNLKLKEEKLFALKKQMQFFKLELINREKNYNEVFGANPNVGVYIPTKDLRGNAFKHKTSNKIGSKNKFLIKNNTENFTNLY